ncbi:MAG: YlxM family DNA-binding protein [Candidatus Dormibacteraceae bacterium]
MDLDRLQARQMNVELFDRYGPLLTDHQRRVLGLHLEQDWSLAEIALAEGISRAAVHDMIQRSQRTLVEHDRRLGLLAEAEARGQTRNRLLRELELVQRKVSQLEALVGAL